MTLQQARRKSDPKRTPPEHTPRLRLKPKAPTTGYVDGAWWPHGDDLATELPDLLAVLAVRLGSIDRVVYNLGEWASAPRKFRTEDRLVHLDGYSRQPVNTIEVMGLDRNKVVLLVVPARTDPERAHDVLMSAAAPGDKSTTVELLHEAAALDG